MRTIILTTVALLAAPSSVSAGPAQDQRLPRIEKPVPVRPGRLPRRFRVAAGPQLQPGFPGNDSLRLTPMFSLSRARGDTPFRFGAPGDGNAVTLLHAGAGAAEFGPLFRLEGERRAGDLIDGLPRVGRTVELGGFAQWWRGDHLRLRGDVRKGINGHQGWISQLGADYVARDGDSWLVSLGPRVVLADRRYQRSWFGVSPPTAVATGLPAYTPGGGLRSVGATSRAFYQLTPRWGVTGQVMYERLVEDAARSPIIRRADSRNQLSVGGGLTYTFSIR